MTPNLAPYAKAVVAALVAGLTSLGTALTDGKVSASELVSVALAFLLGLGIVYAAPKNADAPARNEDGNVDPGSLALGVVLGFIAAVLYLNR